MMYPSSFSHLCAYSRGSPLSRAVNRRCRTQHPGHTIWFSPLLSACWRDPFPFEEDDATARLWPEGGTGFTVIYARADQLSKERWFVLKRPRRDTNEGRDIKVTVTSSEELHAQAERAKSLYDMAAP